MGVGRFTPLRFTANIKSILHACFWSCFFLRYAFERIYEYFLNKFPKSIASDDGMFFMPKSLVKMRTSYDRSNSDSVYRIDK